MRLLLASLVLFGLWFFTSDIVAEPWIANRFAQNCSSCHSPSRRNLPVKERRCTLACQGCHVNPNGGGMRSSYGVWNQQRWLRSMKSHKLRDKGLPAPMPKQKYAKMPNKIRNHKSLRRFINNGPSLVTLPGVDFELKDHDKSDKQEHITVRSKGEFLARVTKEDPWRIEREQSLFAGGDVRWFFINQTGDSIPKNRESMMGFMAADFYVKHRPIKENLSFVVESRFLNDPKNPEVERAFSSTARVRSAYVLIDDLPYATYIMHGLYRPMFGHYTPDHKGLAQQIIYADAKSGLLGGGSYSTVNRALTIGGSPNVPFANIHVIMRPDKTNTVITDEEGFAVNFGGRFVSYGASIMGSYWSTKEWDTEPTTGLKRNMWSVTGGMNIGRFVMNIDFTEVDKEFEVGGSDKGQVYSAELKYRAWRESYAMINFAKSSTAQNLKEGSASETAFGFRSYLWGGSSLEALMIQKENREKPNITKSNILQVQAHVFF